MIQVSFCTALLTFSSSKGGMLNTMLNATATAVPFRFSIVFACVVNQKYIPSSATVRGRNPGEWWEDNFSQGINHKNKAVYFLYIMIYMYTLFCIRTQDTLIITSNIPASG